MAEISDEVDSKQIRSQTSDLNLSSMHFLSSLYFFNLNFNLWDGFSFLQGGAAVLLAVRSEFNAADLYSTEGKTSQ